MAQTGPPTQGDALGEPLVEPLAAEPLGIEPFHLAHLNILCRDWRRSLDFYRRVFAARYLFHLGPTKVVTELRGFELFLEEVRQFTVNPLFHFGIRTTSEGVHAFARRLERLGVPMVRGNNPAPGPMTGPDGVRVALYLEDPDGWLIEVYSPEQRVLDSELLTRDPRWRDVR
jgi:catechol 2,3-dioxygenase-like lactoylglutathione lyase family enzyme